jgi:hypothetical protein
MLMEAVKCVLLHTLVAKSEQHVVQKNALAIVFFSCTHFGLDCDEQNHHFLKDQYFQLVLHSHGVHFGMLPRMEPSSDAQWSGNLTSALSFWDSPSYFLKLLRKTQVLFP